MPAKVLLSYIIIPWFHAPVQDWKASLQEGCERGDWEKGLNVMIPCCLHRRPNTIGFCWSAWIVLHKHNQKFLGMCLWLWRFGAKYDIKQDQQTLLKTKIKLSIVMLVQFYIFLFQKVHGFNAKQCHWRHTVLSLGRSRSSSCELGEKQILEVYNQWWVWQVSRTIMSGFPIQV